MEKLLSIGKILNFHGIKGEVKVGFTEGDEKVFSEITEIYAIKDSQTYKLHIEQVRFHKKFALIKFKEINSIDDTVKFKNFLLKVPKEKLMDYLEQDEFYITDLIGLDVYDELKNYIGKVSGVMNNKEQDILLVKDAENKEHMIPFIKNIVPEINMEQKTIIINKIEGLFE